MRGGEATKHVPAASVLIDGAPLAPKYADQIVEIVVTDNLAMPDVAQVTFLGGFGEEILIDDATFDVGKEIEIKLAGMQASSTTSVFKGLLVALEPEFLDNARVRMVLRAYDHSVKLTRGSKTRTFQNMTTSDIVKKILGEAGLGAGSIHATSVAQPYVMQGAESDWSFIQRLAREVDCEFLVDDKKGILRKLDDPNRTEAPELKYGETLISFSPRITVAQQPAEVAVRGWDPVKKQAIVGTASKGTVSHSNGYGSISNKARTALGAGSKLELASRAVTVQAEATNLAQSALSRLAEAGFEATGVAFGDPKLKAGSKVKIEGVGTRLTGTYLLSSTVHRYTKQGYRTKFQISGRNPRTLTDVLGGGAGNGANGQPAGAFGSGLVVGIVTNVADPDSLGRVKVKFPTLSDTEESGWARLVTLHAGDGRGIMFMPEVNDEVVVAFEQGDLRRPYVLGGVFTGRDKPTGDLFKPNDDKHNGSMVVSSHKKLLMESKKEYTLKVGDKTTIEGKGDYKHVNDKSIVIETKPGQNITIKAGGALQLEAMQGVKIDGMTVDLSGKAAVNVKGPTINVG